MTSKHKLVYSETLDVFLHEQPKEIQQAPTFMVIDRPAISQRMIERLLTLLTGGMGLTLSEVAKKSGVEYDTLSQIRAGRVRSMRCDTLAAIIKVYPSINANYILTGEGDKLLTASNLTDEVPIIYITKQGNVRVEVQE